MPGIFSCAACGRKYQWTPGLAGRSLECKCGAELHVPTTDAPEAILPFATIAARTPSSSSEHNDQGPYAVAPPPLPTVASPEATAVATPVPTLPYATPPGLGPSDTRCQLCGSARPTKLVEFHQNIGAIAVRFHRRIRGKLCKGCIHKKYWQMTGVTLTVGWLGYISVILAPIFIFSNTIRYVSCLGMPSGKK